MTVASGSVRPGRLRPSSTSDGARPGRMRIVAPEAPAWASTPSALVARVTLAVGATAICAITIVSSCRSSSSPVSTASRSMSVRSLTAPVIGRSASSSGSVTDSTPSNSGVSSGSSAVPPGASTLMTSSPEAEVASVFAPSAVAVVSTQARPASASEMAPPVSSARSMSTAHTSLDAGPPGAADGAAPGTGVPASSRRGAVGLGLGAGGDRRAGGRDGQVLAEQRQLQGGGVGAGAVGVELGVIECTALTGTNAIAPIAPAARTAVVRLSIVWSSSRGRSPGHHVGVLRHCSGAARRSSVLLTPGAPSTRHFAVVKG